MPTNRDVNPAPVPDLVFDTCDPVDERRREALFSLGNGLLLVRDCAPFAVADEHHYPGTYCAGCYNRLASEIDGEVVESESLVNLPNWLPLTFRADGEAEWFTLERVEILAYRHRLDLDRGIARRDVRFRDRQGRHTRVSSEMLVSMAHPQLAALRVEIEPQDWSGRIEIRSAVDGGVINDNVPRFAAFERRHLDPPRGEAVDPGILLLQAVTRQSRTKIAVAVRTSVPGGIPAAREVRWDGAAIAEHRSCAVEAGRVLAVEKTAAVFTSRHAANGGPGEAALDALRTAPAFAGLRAAHAEAWTALWRRCGIDIASRELSQAIHFHVFHVLQTVSPHSAGLDVGFPARGWQEAYHGQIFWDELLVFPFLNLRFPELARALLLYRYRRLDEARRAARRHGHGGAMYPWRSAGSGREETPRLQLNPLSGRWMRDHTNLQRHIGAAIAFDVRQYVLTTGDDAFLSDYGAEMLVEIARFFASIARFDPASGRYGIGGVVGPDEYHTAYPDACAPGLVDNAYTNLMAVWTLRRAAEALDALPPGRRAELSRHLGLDARELTSWDEIGRRMRLAFHDDGIVSQFDGFERLRPLDLEAFKRRHAGRRVDWAMEAQGDGIAAYQVVKQADFLMLLYLLPVDEIIELAGRLGYWLTHDQLRRSADYYLARTSHDSSLSRVACAGALAQWDVAASWAWFGQALRPELNPSNRLSSREGVHLGAMAGTIDILQRRYLGLDVASDAIVLEPAIPPGLGPVRMDVRCRFGRFELEWSGSHLCLHACAGNGSDVAVLYRGRPHTLGPGGSVAFEAG